MHKKFRMLSPGESGQPYYGTTQLFFFLLCAVFRVFIQPAVRPTLLQQMDIGSLTCAQIWVPAIHSKGQVQTSPMDKQTFPHPGINPGFSDLNSDYIHWAAFFVDSDGDHEPLVVCMMILVILDVDDIDIELKMRWFLTQRCIKIWHDEHCLKVSHLSTC